MRSLLQFVIRLHRKRSHSSQLQRSDLAKTKRKSDQLHKRLGDANEMGIALRSKTVLRKSIYFFFSVVILAIVTTVTLKSSYLNEVAKEYLINLAQEKLGYQLQIDDINISFPTSAYISSATISDDEVLIALVDGLKIDIRPSLDIFNDIHITNISANNVVIYKLLKSIDASIVQNTPLPESIADSDIMEGFGSETLSRGDTIQSSEGASLAKQSNNAIYKKALVEDGPPIISFDFVGNGHLLLSKGDLEIIEINLESKLLNDIKSKNIRLDSQLSLKASIDLKETKFNLEKADLVLLTQDTAGEDITIKANLNGFMDGSVGVLKGCVALSKKEGRSLSDLYSFPDLQLEAKFNYLGGDALGNIRLEHGNFTGSGDFTFKDKVLNLPNLAISSNFSSKKVSIKYDVGNNILASHITFTSSDLKDFKEFLPNLDDGKISLDANCNLDFDKQIYSLKIDGQLDNFSYQLLHLDHADLKANFTNFLALEFDKLELNANSINYDGTLIAKSKLKAVSDRPLETLKHQEQTPGSNRDKNSSIFTNNKSISIQTDLKILQPYELNISSDQKITVSNNKISLNVTRFDGDLNNTAIRLKKPIVIDLGQDLIITAPLISLNKGLLSLNLNINNFKNRLIGRFPDGHQFEGSQGSDPTPTSAVNFSRNHDEQSIDGNVKFTNISLYDIFQSNQSIRDVFYKSNTSGGLSISGSMSHPIVESKIEVHNIAILDIQSDMYNKSLASDDDDNTTQILKRIKSIKRTSKGLMSHYRTNASLKIATSCTTNKLIGSAVISLSDKEIASLKLDIPIMMDLSKGDFEIYKDKEVHIEFKLANKLELLSLIPTPPGHNIRGFLEGGFKARGSLDKLDVSGGMDLSEGKYSYKPLGIRVVDVSSKIVASGLSINLLNIYMADKFGNKISGTGIIDIMSDCGYKIDLITEKFELFNSPHLQGTIAGRANIIGNRSSCTLFGDLLIGPMEIKIPEMIQHDFAELNVTKVIEAEDGRSDVSFNRSDSKDDKYRLFFNVNVNTYQYLKHKADKSLKRDADNTSEGLGTEQFYTNTMIHSNSKGYSNSNTQSLSNSSLEMKDLGNIHNKMVFVRGWGVDTRLEGGLQISGCSDNPLIYGKLSAVDGRYTEFGHQLNIERGVLKFEGSIPPSPFLDIVGLLKEDDKEFRISLTGPIKSPQISIASNPAMEEEEALSVILFGNNPDNISVFQAFQLASSARRLSGHGSNTDIIGASKKAIGIDEISFRNSSKDPGHNVVAVGKYLSDKFYIEVEQGIDEGTKTKLEVELSPKVTVEAFTESDGNSGVGANWKYDY